MAVWRVTGERCLIWAKMLVFLPPSFLPFLSFPFIPMKMGENFFCPIIFSDMMIYIGMWLLSEYLKVGLWEKLMGETPGSQVLLLHILLRIFEKNIKGLFPSVEGAAQQELMAYGLPLSYLPSHCSVPKSVSFFRVTLLWLCLVFWLSCSLCSLSPWPFGIFFLQTQNLWT